MTSVMARPESSLSCPPRWGTPRSLHRPTLGQRVAEVAQLLGTPLMPWQRLVADAALEVDPATGLLVYREVVLTVPRQSGKTLLLLCLMVHRALGFGQRQRILYTAQTRNDARRKWEDEHVAVLEASPFGGMFVVRKSNGAEAIRWNNGSMHGVTSSTEKAGHGETLDLGVMDEAFAHEDPRLEQAMKPAMITRPQPQAWVVSTAGTDRSTFLRGKIDAGRQRVTAGVTAGSAYFEWSAADDADPGAAATWRSCMPALGHTVTERAIRAEYESMELPEFRRAFLNQWPDVFPVDAVIPGEAWQALTDPRSRAQDPVAFAADMTPDRSSSAIAVSGLRPDGNVHVEIVDCHPGTEWVVDRVAQLAARWKPCAVVIDGAGPAGSFIAPLEARGIEIIKPSARDMAQACGQFYDHAVNKTLRHLDQAPLAAALAGARRRDLGDAWAWARKNVTVDICPLVAATLAAWGHATRAHTYTGDYDPLSNFW